MRFWKNKHDDISDLFHKWIAQCIKQTVCKVLKIFQHGKYLVAYVLKTNSFICLRENNWANLIEACTSGFPSYHIKSHMLIYRARSKIAEKGILFYKGGFNLLIFLHIFLKYLYENEAIWSLKVGSRKPLYPLLIHHCYKHTQYSKTYHKRLLKNRQPKIIKTNGSLIKV